MVPGTDLPDEMDSREAMLAGRGGLAAGPRTDVPNVARVYDAFLDGKDNFAVDRAVVRQVAEAVPGVLMSVREHRAFLGRAVRFVVEAGIGQIVDLGAGLPTMRNTHTVAQELEPGTRVMYVDNDPVVLAHARARLADNDRVGVLDADLRDPALLDAPELRALIDVSRPFALIMAAVIHHLTDDQEAATLVERYKRRMPPGSYLVLTHLVTGTAAHHQMEQTLFGGDPKTGKFRTREQIEQYFSGLELVHPGVVHDPLWRPDGPLPPDIGSRFMAGVAGVAKAPE